MYSVRTRALIALILAMCCFALCGCAASTEQENGALEQAEDSEAGLRRTVLYYQSDDGFVVPVMKLIPWEEGIGKAALSYLVDTPENRLAAEAMGLNTLIPEGTSYTLRISDDKVATLDLMGLTAWQDAATERAMVEAIVNTLSEFPTIDAVTITLNGKSVSELPNGAVLKAAMTPFALNAEDGEITASTEGANALTLYFANRSGSLNVPVTRYVQNGATFEAAMQALLAGPMDEALMNCFPEGTQLLGADIYDGVARVNLSGEFLSAQYTDGLIQTAYDTMYLTANAMQEIYALELTVEGKPCELTESCTAPVYANTFR